MRLGIVVQRYGPGVSGGAELHARYIAQHLSRHAAVRVLTTCARDYVTWRNEFPAGADVVEGIPVERFPVAHERDPWEFGQQSGRVFECWHSIADELRWLAVEGPFCPPLVERLLSSRDEFDYVLFFNARYYQAVHGARTVPKQAILVPTTERDAALGLWILGSLFRSVRALMYNSFEERAAIQAVSGNDHVPGVVVGVGSEIPSHVSAQRFRQKYGIADRFILYVGRIDSNKGCDELFDYFSSYAAATPHPPLLLLIGSPLLEIPRHAHIRHLGQLSDEDKFDAMAAAEALVVPSYYESLSMVALEAWALGRPVLANARCDVLLGQCLRSNAGLYYENAGEFSAALERLLDDRGVAAALGRNGRAFYERHYDWPVIERTYLDMFAQLDAEGAVSRREPLPGWLARRRRTLPPAAEVIRRIPAGPAVERGRERASRAGEGIS